MSKNKEELEKFQNKWRIIILKHISALLKHIADIFEVEEKEMAIAYCTIEGYRYPMDILNKDNKPGFLHIPGLFKYIENVNNLTECDEVKMYNSVKEIKDLIHIFIESGR